MTAPATQAALYAIELRTARWPQMLAWYRGVLGARSLVRIVEDGYALLELGGTRLALLARIVSAEPSDRWNLAFEVKDLQPFMDRLQQAGSSFEQPAANDESLVQIRCHDPDGNSIRLFIWPENLL